MPGDFLTWVSLVWSLDWCQIKAENGSAGDMAERFIGEDIKPVVATIDTSRMATGEPGVPREFIWRGQTVEVLAVLRTWHETGPCSHGSSEKYVRKHWFEVSTVSSGTMKIYFERQPRSRQKGSNMAAVYYCG